MITDWMYYPVPSKLLDVTVTQLAPNVPVKSSSTGSNTVGADSTIEITNNTVNTTAIPNQQVADATDVIVFPPVLADGTTPKGEFWFELDGLSLDAYQIFDFSADGNMFPNPQLNVGRRIRIGKSLRNTLMRISNGEKFKNPLLECTGLKVTQQLRVVVKSTVGWGPGASDTSAVVTPLRIMVMGDTMDSKTIDPLTYALAGYTSIAIKDAYFGDINVSVLDPAIPQAALLTQIWNTLPGGVKQGTTKINRRINYATNELATSTSKLYSFTQSTKMLGTEDNVLDSQHDLGDDFSDPTNNDIFIYDGLGLRLPSNVAAYVGFNVDGQNIPNNEQNAGLDVSASNNPLHFGSVQPIRSESNLFYGIPDVRKLTPMVVQNAAVVPFISTVGTTAIAAGDVEMAKTGWLIER